MNRNAQADTRTEVRWPARSLARVSVIAWLLVAVAVAGASSALAETRIGYVEMKRLLDNAPQMSQGNTRLQQEFAERDRQLRADEARLETLRGQGSGDGDEIQALERRVQRTRESLREELRRRSDEEVERNFRTINETVAAYARENNYDLIVHSPVFYASPTIDITDQILARLRAQNADGD